jgi:hypothetical protein
MHITAIYIRNVLASRKKTNIPYTSHKFRIL